MKKRQSIVEKYSCFLKFANCNDRLVTTWEFVPKVENNMKCLVESDRDAKEEFWTQYWLKEVLKENADELAKGHLSAYLEETCYWTAITTAQKLAFSDYTWIDCFQVARSIAADPAKLFAKYDCNRSRLNTFSQLKLKSAILETVRAGREQEKYTDAALLRSISKISLERALKKAGISLAEIDRYLLAWRCFKEIYVPTKAAGSQKLQWPDAKQLDAIAIRYDRLRLDYSLSANIAISELDKLLSTCVKVVRDVTTPKVRSLDESDMQLPAPNEDFWESESSGEEWQQINSILSQTFAGLTDDDRHLLQLEFGWGFKQTDIGKILKLKQYQVSRQIDRAKRKLVTDLAQWSQQQLNINLTAEQIGLLVDRIDEWLKWYCQSLLSEILQTILFEDLRPEVELLRLYYGHNSYQEVVAKNLGISEALVNERLMRVKQHLSAKLQDKIPITLQIKSTEQRVDSLVESWLKNAEYATFET